MVYDIKSSALYKLLLDGKSYKLPKGQVVNFIGDSARLYLLKSGFIKRYLITKDGTKSIQIIYGPDDIFPLTPVYKAVFGLNIYSGPIDYFYESMTDIEIISVSQEELMGAIKKDPVLYQDLFFSAGLRLNGYIHRLESSSLRVANRKIVHQLLFYASTFGEQTDEGVMIQIPLTHQTLADALNLARETVTHCLKRLEDKKLIKVGKNIVILDRDGLNKASHII